MYNLTDPFRQLCYWNKHTIGSSLIELIRKLLRPLIGTRTMVGIVLPYAFPKSACALHVPCAGKEEIGDVLCSQHHRYRDSCKKWGSSSISLPHEAAVCRSLSWRGLALKELWHPASPKLCPAVMFSVVNIDFSCRCTGWSKKLPGTSSLLDKFLTPLLRRQQQKQSLLLTLLLAVFQPLSAEPTNYVYFNLSYIWCISDEILSKIFVHFTIWHNGHQYKGRRVQAAETPGAAPWYSCAENFPGDENLQMLDLIRTGTASAGNLNMFGFPSWTLL